MAPQTDPTLNILLKNNTASPTLHVHITGLALESGNAPFLLRSDGKTPYLPPSPPGILTPLPVDCSIALGPPGSTRTVTIPRLAGGRIWYSVDGPLTFLLNPGPAIVEPSVMNPSDPNHGLSWGFAEFTYNDFQLFVNVSYVDFVSIPVSLTLETKAGERMVVEGLPKDGLDRVCAKLREQDARDKAGWGQLVVPRPGGGGNLRALSPNSGMVASGGALFKDYFAAQVDAVWARYAGGRSLTVNTQAGWGDVTGKVVDGKLSFSGAGAFGKPSTGDIFSCSTGPFARGADWTELRGNVAARIAAALNRSTLLANDRQPEGEKVEGYYREAVTNHYSRICHETSIHGRGYAFPYDDVGPANGVDQSGSLWHSEPKLLTLGIGGGL
ncbi:related to beta-1,3-glucanase [Cephalotrichum gorgonifer]|uniref:Related to beta-1,3-glucanase n=1 Tax=Cephalotrichum gorgonifer TaxID=2041049 RepID=A0AAE8MVG1_9PEZI|nr:related to beta-1,3-glucanase [Cephalotrichum gorgonifer]